MRRNCYLLFVIVLSFLVANLLPLCTFALDIDLDPYQVLVTPRNVGGGLSHLADGDIIAFTSDFAAGTALRRIDANGDGIPGGGTKLLKQFDPSVFPDFVQVSPSGEFALAGVSGSSEMIYWINLQTDAVTPYLNVPGNYDLVFRDEFTAYISANPAGFNPSGANRISLIQLSNPPVMTPLIEVFGTPSGPIALNNRGDLYYVKGTFTFPPPANSARLYRFSQTQLDQALVNSQVLGAGDSDIALPLNGGYDLVFHALSANSGEFFLSAIDEKILRIPESTLQPEVFLSINDPTFPAVTGLSFFQAAGSFDNSAPTHSELAAALALDFFASHHLLQVRPLSYLPIEQLPVDENGFCKDAAVDCYYQDLKPSACVGANGFLGQINIASVLNVSAQDLSTVVQYFDSSGALKGSVSTIVPPGLKRDFIINELGLKPDSVGTVCVATSGGINAWSGGLALYKPRDGGESKVFGDSFDFALYYPFLNPFQTPTTVPLNTYHLGLSPAATVANWITLIDAERDGYPLTGSLVYYNDLGQTIAEEFVNIPDGGRFDYDGHLALAGPSNADAVGMAQFFPAAKVGTIKAKYYMTVTRYFYDCPASSCNNFLTAFNLPYRPGTDASIFGASSTVDGEISIIELNNTGATSAQAQVSVFGENGLSLGQPQVEVPARGTRHVILNRAGQTGFVAENSLATSAVSSAAPISAVSLFYKLDSLGRLAYAYAAPLLGSPGAKQVTQFNSFISHENILELHNAGDNLVEVSLDWYSYTGDLINSAQLQLEPRKTTRLLKLPTVSDLYGTIEIQSSAAGVLTRNYIRRAGQYTLSFPGQ